MSVFSPSSKREAAEKFYSFLSFFFKGKLQRERKLFKNSGGGRKASERVIPVSQSRALISPFTKNFVFFGAGGDLIRAELVNEFRPLPPLSTHPRPKGRGGLDGR